MADYKYLKENNLFEAHMRYMRALGESFAPIEEADDDPNQQDDQNNSNGAPGQDPMGGGMPGQNGGMPDPNAGGGMPGPDMMGGGQDPMGGGMPGQDGGMPDPNAGGDMPGPDMMGGEDPMGGDMPPGGLDEEEPEEEDDVIDVDDLTDAQEKVNDKVNSVGRDLGKVDSRIEKLIGAIEKLQTMFDKNNQEIADLKTEFEKRNPTQTEKLNLRSLDSYPFKVRPTDYWADKAKNSNYSAYADNQEPTTQEYVITNDDVDDFTEREIADSFSIADELDQDIKKIFGL
jgi:hypothetical protein